MIASTWSTLSASHCGTANPAQPCMDDDALEMMLRLACDEGIFAGISTGANVVGAHRLAQRLGPDTVIVTPAVDTAFKYMSLSPLSDL